MLSLQYFTIIEFTLIAAMVLRVINITIGKMDLKRRSSSISIGTYLSQKTRFGFTLPSLSQVKAKKCGMAKMKDIAVARHI